MQPIVVQNIPVRIPENLDYQSLTKRFPPDFRCNYDKIKFILDFLINRLSWNRRYYERKQLPFIEMSSVKLKLYVNDYHKYMRYLVKAGVLIKSDKGYSTGKFSNSYQLAEEYRTRTKDDFIRDKRLIKTIFRVTAEENQLAQERLPHLVKWMQGLRINSSLAKRWSEWNLDKALSKSFKEVKRQKAYFKHANHMQAIARISRGYNRCIIDESGHRLHSVLTNIKSDLRHAISYMGQPMVSIDLSSSQVYLLSVLRRQEFYWSGNSYTGINSSSLAENVVDKLARVTDIILFNMHAKEAQGFPMCVNDSFPYMCVNLSDKSSLNIPINKGDDWTTLREQVEAGSFYEFMLNESIKLAEGSQLLSSNEKMTRSFMKKIVFSVLFSKNNSRSSKIKRYKSIFRMIFPSVSLLTELIKSREHNTLALLLQNIESEIFLNRITKRIAHERPETPIFTIHDSICTTVGNEEYIERIAKEELVMATGLIPCLKREYWKEDVLESQINPDSY